MAIDPITLYDEMPSRPNTKPPSSDPITPTTRSPRRPKPVPRMILPASQPAMTPIRMSLMIAIVVGLWSLVFGRWSLVVGRWSLAGLTTNDQTLTTKNAPSLPLDIFGHVQRSVGRHRESARPRRCVARVHD